MSDVTDWGKKDPAFGLQAEYGEAASKIRALSDGDLASTIRRCGPAVPNSADREDLENLAIWLWLGQFASRCALVAEEHAARPKHTLGDPFFGESA